jgi:uncharacterized membrane protein YjgN (DUF898 family)
MAPLRYAVVYSGELIDGTDFERARDNLARLVAVDTQSAGQLLGSARVVFKRGLDEISARHYAAALRRAGLRVTLETEQPPAVREPLPATPPDGVAAAPAVGSRPAPPPPPDTEPPPAVPTPPPGAQTAMAFEFHGSGGEYCRIWLVNMLLSILTLGIYSAWAKVRRKQYFYGNTRLAGAGFEYLADPKNILKGRAIVGALLLAMNALSGLLPTIGQVLLTLAFVVAIPWIAVRSLAFNARNSALRNIRFGFAAGYGQAAKVFLVWPLLAALSLGILAPYAYFKQKQFIAIHSTYGTTGFSFEAAGRDYYRIFLALLLPIALGGALLAAMVYFMSPAAVVVGAGLYLYLFAAFSVKSANLFYNVSRLGAHRFVSDMTVREYAVLVLTNTLATVCTLGLFYPWATVRTTRYRLRHLALLPAGDLERFVAAERQQISAMGDAASDLLDFDFGL